MDRILTLRLKTKHFNAIRAGTKKFEFRLVKPYWYKRIASVLFDGIILTLGYPSNSNPDRTISRPWRGYTIKTITNPEFGPNPVKVFSIQVN